MQNKKVVISFTLVLLVVGLIILFVWGNAKTDNQGWPVSSRHIYELERSIKLMGGVVSPAQLKLVKQAALKIRIDSKMDVEQFCNLFQFSIDKKLFKDSLNRKFYIMAEEVDVLEDAVLIKYRICSESFMFFSPSFFRPFHFEEDKLKVEGFLCVSAKEPVR